MQQGQVVPMTSMGSIELLDSVFVERLDGVRSPNLCFWLRTISGGAEIVFTIMKLFLV